jgi:hypothetical protein
VRFAVFAKEAVKVIADARQVEALPSNEKGLPTHVIFERVKAKTAAAHDIATFSALLYPEDEVA